MKLYETRLEVFNAITKLPDADKDKCIDALISLAIHDTAGLKQSQEGVVESITMSLMILAIKKM